MDIHSLLIYRSELKEILFGVDNDLKSHGNSEISLSIENENEDEAVSVDIREQLFAAIASLKEKIGIMTETG